MIVWLASFPRSGNTLARILLHRLYGVTSSTVYDLDGVAARLGPELIGYRKHEGSYDDLRISSGVHVVKTHRPCDELIDQDDKVLCVVRDGRDSVVSWARQRAEQPGQTFEHQLQDLLLRPEQRGAGAWGTNVLSWIGRGEQQNRAVVRFEELVTDPVKAMTDAVARLDLPLEPDTDGTSPRFEELHRIDPRFFRRGVVGSYHDEMPSEQQEAFLAVSDNRAALRLFGYQ